jgi:hypothetical protein
MTPDGRSKRSFSVGSRECSPRGISGAPRRFAQCAARGQLMAGCRDSSSAKREVELTALRITETESVFAVERLS